MKRIAIICAAAFCCLSVSAQKPWDLKHFPEGFEPEEVGERLVKHYLETPHSNWGNVEGQKGAFSMVTYPDVCAWLGSLWFATETGNDELYGKLVERFEPIFTTESHLQPSLRPKAHNIVDFHVFGAVPLEIYKRVKDSRYLELGLKYADDQWNLPENATEKQREWHEKGHSWQTRLWIDDMFMITALQANAYLVTGEKKYLDRIADEMVLYLDTIQRPNGLFYHSDYVPYFWGRGDGWMAVGMSQMLKLLPKDHPTRPRIEQAYRLMMKTLLQYQGYNGMWHQLIDDPYSWEETSCTAMFTYAFITGVKEGWLDKKLYGTAARKAWISLQSFLTENDELRSVCEGTGAKNSYDYYLARKRRIGDLHGQAAYIWCAYALVK